MRVCVCVLISVFVHVVKVCERKRTSFPDAKMIDISN